MASQVTHKGLEVFSVPCGIDEERVFQIIFSVYEDGTLSLPSDLTDAQRHAITAYITHNNQHLQVKRGNSLSVMTKEEQVLFDAVIDVLKDDEQRHYEAITNLVLGEYTLTHEWWQYFISWFEKTDRRWWTDVPDVTEQDWLYEVQVTENYEGYFSYRVPSIHTWHIVREKPTGELDILQACCWFHKNERYLEDLCE